MAISADDFGKAFQAFMRQMAGQTPSTEAAVLDRFRKHFGCDPATLPVLSETFDKYDHPNLHLAVETYLSEEGRSAEVFGVTHEHRGYATMNLSELVVPPKPSLWGESGPSEGPVEYSNVPLEEDRALACVSSGVYLIRDGDTRLAMLIDKPREEWAHAKLHVEVMAAERAAAEGLLQTLRRTMRRQNVYRGHVISLEVDDMHSLRIRFHRRPAIARDGIILPQGLLDRIERLTIRFTRYSESLLAAGRHLKRGLLLHGRPGTGKTLTAMYLAGALKERTVLLVTGRGQGFIEHCCVMARMLQPSVVIVEDVDLIAGERTREDCATPLLFELLNQMDGLAEDCDVLFLLTTNRPDLLEPALAARPGRIDQAIEIPLPDEACRRRLFELYSHGLTMRVNDVTRLVRRTQGASGAFIRELLRKAALFAADEANGVQIVVHERHIDEALRDLVLEGGDLTKSLLGFRSDGSSEA
jgi:hypothetical protein